VGFIRIKIAHMFYLFQEPAPTITPKILPVNIVLTVSSTWKVNKRISIKRLKGSWKEKRELIVFEDINKFKPGGV